VSADDGWSAVPDRAAPDHAGTTDVRVQGRPAPQYGEYAPDGWVNPVLAEQERREQARAAQQATATGAPRTSTAARTTTASRTPAPARDQAPADGPVAARFGASPVDFLLSVMLLAFGLVSVVQSLSVGTVASGVARELELRYTALSDPGELTTAAIVSALGSVVVFVLVAWWSIVRLRRRKRTVWVPLLGGVVATVVTMSAFLTVVMQDGHFMAWLVQHAGS